MGFLPDFLIKSFVKKYNMIEPFIDHQVREYNHKKVISYGITSAGYDIRLADEFKLIEPNWHFTIDPKENPPIVTYDEKRDFCINPANGFCLARSVEYFRMPPDIIGIAVGKSTYARCGLVVNITPLEPGWEGYLTIELSNTTPNPIKVYANEGIAQILFYKLASPPEVTYADRGGKYQKQMGIELPKP